MPHSTNTALSEDSDIVKISPPTFNKPLNEVEYPQVKIEGDKHSHVKHEIEMSDIKQATEQAAADVQGTMDDTVRRIRETSDRLQQVALPYANRTKSFAEERPVLFTYLAILIALSIVPICIFVGFVLSITTLILGTAAFFICLFTFGTIVLGVSILLPILIFTTFLSLCTLTFLLGLFLLHRLYLHVSASVSNSDEQADVAALSTGVKTWLEETKSRVNVSVPGLPKVGLGIKWGPVEGSDSWSLGAKGDVGLGGRALEVAGGIKIETADDTHIGREQVGGIKF
ncbi:hypothetical protein P7C73_g828, partial [Tremellales sp. Uapishka_1]